MANDYPKYLFHKTAPTGLLVADEAAEKALGSGWVESPAELTKKQTAPAAPAAAEEKPAEEHHAPEKHSKKVK